MIKPATLGFLKSLRKNNNKPWFDQNREKYLEAQQNFEEFISILLTKMASVDEDLRDLKTKDCIFRIYRDVRFSKDKTPYKLSRSASFARGGKKSIYAGYYIQIQPGGNSVAGGGIWHPGAEELSKIRQEIDYCLPEFKSITSNRTFKKYYDGLDKEEMLVNVPKGYDKENPAAEFLKLKNIIASRSFSDEEVLSDTFVNEAVKTFKVLKPLIQFINRALD